MPKSATPKKATNLSLDQRLVADAKALGVSLSKAAESGVRDAVKLAKEEAWKHENAEAIKYANQWYAENGLPFDKLRI